MIAIYYLISILLAYFLGSVPFGFIAGKINGIDIRKAGSGNIGATNVFRVVGKKWGIAVFIMDFLKGFISVMLIPCILNYSLKANLPYLDLFCALAAVAGHTWTIFLNFKGGKGVATGVGALMGLAPFAALTALVIWAISFVSTGYVSLSSIIAAIVAGSSTWWYYPDKPYHNLVINILAALIIIKHHSNIDRLVHKKENKFLFKRKGK
jgi:glycerol-3-phosphate acyltransferase PlsY